jgi:hypothetical protein
VDIGNALLPRGVERCTIRKNSTADPEIEKKIHKEEGEEMISRKDVDKLFLWTLPIIVISNGITWSFYFHIHNLIGSLTMDQFYAAVQSDNLAVAWIIFEYFYKHTMQPYLYTSFAFCGLALVWLLWSWALNNGLDSTST